MSLFGKKKTDAAPEAAAAAPAKKGKGLSLRRVKYPSKTSINLAIVEKSPSDPIRVIPLFLLFLVVVGFFSKFCVIDRFVAVNAAEAEVARLQGEQARYMELLVPYPQVSEEYQRYANEWMSTTEATLVDRLTVLSLVDAYLSYAATVSQVNIQGTTISMNLGDITLERAAEIVVALRENELVSGVTVYTASSSGQSALGSQGDPVDPSTGAYLPTAGSTTVSVTIELTTDHHWTVPSVDSLF